MATIGRARTGAAEAAGVGRRRRPRGGRRDLERRPGDRLGTRRDGLVERAHVVDLGASRGDFGVELGQLLLALVEAARHRAQVGDPRRALLAVVGALDGALAAVRALPRAQLVHLVGERAHAQRVGGAGVGHRRRRRDVGREHHGAGMLVAEVRPFAVEREASTHDVLAARRALVRPVGVAAAVPRRRPRARVGREVDRLVLLRHGSGAGHCVEERLPLRAVRACSLEEAVDERRDRERRGRVAGGRAEGEGERGGHRFARAARAFASGLVLS